MNRAMERGIAHLRGGPLSLIVNRGKTGSAWEEPGQFLTNYFFISMLPRSTQAERIALNLIVVVQDKDIKIKYIFLL